LPPLARSTWDAIEKALQPLLGLPLRETHRIVDMQVFGFGDLVPNSGEDRRRAAAIAARPRRAEVPEFALHVQCRWRIVRNGSILVGAADIFWPGAESEVAYQEFDNDGARSRRDELVDSFMAHGQDSHVVRKIEGASTGDARIQFVDGYALELWPDHRSGAEADGPDEYWRFFRDRDRHFVVGAGGVE
jgi:hypothetical protein